MVTLILVGQILSPKSCTSLSGSAVLLQLALVMQVFIVPCIRQPVTHGWIIICLAAASAYFSSMKLRDMNSCEEGERSFIALLVSMPL
jgi:hypothetical protein